VLEPLSPEAFAGIAPSKFYKAHSPVLLTVASRSEDVSANCDVTKRFFERVGNTSNSQQKRESF